jgi:hypothetical protein
MRNRQISTVVLAVLSAGTIWSQPPQQVPQHQAPQQQDTDSRAREELPGRLVNDPVIKKQVEPAEAAEASRARQREANTCAVPDGTRVELNTEVVFDGRLYRCVEGFETNNAPAMANARLKRRDAGLVCV